MIKELLENRILILDGALGTMVQSYNLGEGDFRGSRFGDWTIELKGCNDILVLTSPHIIKEIHTKYLSAGADIISTDSFNANAISMADYGLGDYVYEINRAAASLACAARDEGGFAGRFVAGSVGPTGRTASISPSVEDPALRNVTFGELFEAYTTQIEGLLDGGADMILVETIFDTLNAKAAIAAHDQACIKRGRTIPLMVSGTVDNAGRTLSGQTIEAFAHSLDYSPNLVSLGLNCSFGAELLYPYLKRLATAAPHVNISVHPNAGLPDVFGNYSHSPEIMCSCVEQFLEGSLVNILGGCCGTTPEHIAHLKSLADKYSPRQLSEKERVLTLTGLEPLRLDSSRGFVNIGERANVAGSAKFARLIREQSYEEAIQIVKNQIETGASIIDVCMDAAMIDSQVEMRHFLNLLASEPDVAAVPLMIDSSKWETLYQGLRCAQGKSIVNSISLKEGPEAFLEKATVIKNFGAAAVVMLFDETGQADSYSRKCEVAKRSYELLMSIDFAAEDIIFDPNVLTVATGIAEHNRYGIDFIEAVRYIKQNLPYAKVSGGVSNFSFAFRGNNVVREAMHAAFLYHAIEAGMDMAIVNAGALVLYEDIDRQLLKAIEDVIFDTDPEATERLIDCATAIKAAASGETNHAAEAKAEKWRDESVEERISYALVRGITQYIDADVLEANELYGSAVRVIEEPLMNGMKRVGELFGQGKMFLPQVVKSARVMKRAVDALTPFLNSGDSSSTGTVVIATVKGDVHDIGKNIVAIVLACNGFNIVDLGVMTPPEKIVEAIREHKPSMLMLSGLITPSLDEMRSVLELLEHENITIDVMVGGATTSQIHTAVKLAPAYSSLVVQTADASSCAKIAVELTGSAREETLAEIKATQALLREQYEAEQRSKTLLSPEKAYQNRAILDFAKASRPNFVGEQLYMPLDFEKCTELINWTLFFAAWQIKGRMPEIFDHPQKGEQAQKLYADAQAMLEKIKTRAEVKAICGIYNAHSKGDSIVVSGAEGQIELETVRQLHPQKDGAANLSLCDFVAPENDFVAMMALSVFGIREMAEEFKAGGDDYSSLMVLLLGDRLAEAAAEYLHYLVRTQLWGYASGEEFDAQKILRNDYQGIRPAFGYPSLPDHAQKRQIFDFMQVEEAIGTALTENFAMLPQSSICAMIFAHPEARYFITE